MHTSIFATSAKSFTWHAYNFVKMAKKTEKGSMVSEMRKGTPQQFEHANMPTLYWCLQKTFEIQTLEFLLV